MACAGHSSGRSGSGTGGLPASESALGGRPVAALHRCQHGPTGGSEDSGTGGPYDVVIDGRGLSWEEFGRAFRPSVVFQLSERQKGTVLLCSVSSLKKLDQRGP
jgi:hypothetical protein